MLPVPAFSWFVSREDVSTLPRKGY